MIFTQISHPWVFYGTKEAKMTFAVYILCSRGSNGDVRRKQIE